MYTLVENEDGSKHLNNIYHEYQTLYLEKTKLKTVDILSKYNLTTYIAFVQVIPAKGSTYHLENAILKIISC